MLISGIYQNLTMYIGFAIYMVRFPYRRYSWQTKQASRAALSPCNTYQTNRYSLAITEGISTSGTRLNVRGLVGSTGSSLRHLLVSSPSEILHMVAFDPKRPFFEPDGCFRSKLPTCKRGRTEWPSEVTLPSFFIAPDCLSQYQPRNP